MSDAVTLPLPCSPSLESESDSKNRIDRKREKKRKMCGRGGDKEDKFERKARTGECVLAISI